MRLNWTDQYLSWDPNDFGGGFELYTLIFPTSKSLFCKVWSKSTSVNRRSGSLTSSCTTMPTAQTCRLVLAHFILITICYLNYSTQNDCDSSSSILLYYDNVTFNTSKGCLELVKPVFKIKTLFLPLILFPLIIHTGCLKKLGFTELNFSRFVTNT